MTSELGPFDAGTSLTSLFDLSWARRATLAVSAGLLLWWILVAPHDPRVLVGVVVTAGVACGPRDRALVDHLHRLLAYVARSRWTYVAMRVENATWSTRARGHAEVVLGELVHRGRLDLSGVDEVIASEFAALMDRVAVADEPRQLSWHVTSDGDGLRTWLAAPASVGLPARWRTLEHLDADGPARSAGWLYERWRYLRTPRGVAAVLQVRGTTSVAGVGALNALAPYGSSRDVSVVVRVAAASRSSAVVGRQVHRWRANAALASLFGFRHRAAAEITTSLLERRERAVATGTAVGQVDVFVVVRAPTRATLDEHVTALQRDARRVGTTLVRGDGRHAPWFCAHLAGGPGWRP